jgi:hypothetical protein
LITATVHGALDVANFAIRCSTTQLDATPRQPIFCRGRAVDGNSLLPNEH